MISMRTASALGRTAGPTGRTAILPTSGLMNPVAEAVSIRVIGRVRPVDVIVDHADWRIAGLKLTRCGSMYILAPGDHAGRSATTGGHRQTQQRTSNHHANWHGFPRQSDSLVPCFVSPSVSPCGPHRMTCCLSIGCSFRATRAFRLDRRAVTTSFFHTRCRV